MRRMSWGESTARRCSLVRLEAGADHLQWQTAAIHEIAGAALAAVQPLAEVRGVTLEPRISPALMLRTDSAKLTKILSNMLANAVEHSAPGESVVINAALDATSLQIAVEDRGPGVPPELRGRIFERFVRGDVSRTADGHHGLGLPIARGLARLLGGDLYLDSDLAPGSRFVLRLSYASPAALE